MNKFLERHSYQHFTQEEIDSLNSPVSIKGIEFITKNLPTKKTPLPDGITVEF